MAKIVKRNLLGKKKANKPVQYAIGGVVALVMLVLWITSPSRGSSFSTAVIAAGNPFSSRVSDVSALSSAGDDTFKSETQKMAEEMGSHDGGNNLLGSLFSSGFEEEKMEFLDGGSEAAAAPSADDGGSVSDSYSSPSASPASGSSVSDGARAKLSALNSSLGGSGGGSTSTSGGGNHNKFSGDNMRRKCKFIVLSHVMNFINKKLVEMYKYIGNGIREKQLKQINKAQIANAKIEYNKSFLTKTLKQIFSDNISTRYTSLPPTKNKILIDELMNETDDIKREYFKNLFSLTFLDCIKYFSSEKDENYIKELDGLQLFKDLKNDSIELKNKNIDTNDKEYIETLEYHLKYYEKIINLKKSRNRKQTTKKVKSLK